MNHVRDPVSPHGQPPPTLPIHSEPPQAAAGRHDDSQTPTPDIGRAHVESRAPQDQDRVYRLPALPSATSARARTGSLLSQISAMVPDEGTSAYYSQNSIPRSTPSAIHRMQPVSATINDTRSRAPAQIQEESPTRQAHYVAHGQGNDLDLYADCNGVVRDLCDETGRPLRLAEARAPSSAPQHEPVTSEGASVEAACESYGGEQPRYSTERPMSFVAGYADQDGKPQDQINQSTTPNHVRVSQQGNLSQQQQRPLQRGTVYAEVPTASLDPPRSSAPSPLSMPGTPPPKSALRTIKSLDFTQRTKHSCIDQVDSPGRANPREPPSQTQSTHGELHQSYHVSDVALHQPRAQRVLQIPHIMPILPQEPAPSHASEWQNLHHGSENHQSFYQQEQQQSAHAPSHDTDRRHATAPAQLTLHEASKPHAKSSSKPKVSSMFKRLGGNGHADVHHQSGADNTTTDSHSRPGKQEHSKLFTARKHQSSDHVSQHSRRSFFDLGKQKDPASLYSIPYHKSQSTTNVSNRSSQLFQPGAPRAGKPRRFSGLSAFLAKMAQALTARPQSLSCRRQKRSRKLKESTMALQKLRLIVNRLLVKRCTRRCKVKTRLSYSHLGCLRLVQRKGPRF